MSIDQNDQRTRRCPRLGHEINFEYCRKGSRVTGRDCPCRKILDCWFETFDVQAFMLENYGPEIIEQITALPQPKITSLIDLIQQAQQAAKNAEKPQDKEP
ncbi:MAG: hypothetical protein JW936_05955 [Sedimentisphaerales bacterium]|nr:hypothetical protein [Sedimentisphaerales bacterium]